MLMEILGSKPMTNTDREEFAKKIVGLSEVFKDPLSEMSIEIYFDALSGFDIDEVSQGITSVVKSRVYNGMPKPAEIIEAIEGGTGVKALSAWDQVISDVRRRGRLQGGKFDDPAITQAVRLCGGWEKICDTEEKNIQFVKKEFIEAFGSVGHTAFRPAIEAQKIISALTEKIG
jgi:hypothetical protein